MGLVRLPSERARNGARLLEEGLREDGRPQAGPARRSHGAWRAPAARAAI